MFFSQDHVIYRAKQKMKKIVAPLKKLAGITYFSYGVNNIDKSCFSLLTHPEYFDEKFKQQFKLQGFYLKPGWHFDNSILEKPEIDARNNLEIGNSISYIIRHPYKSEIFTFGTTPDNHQVYNFYLNNLNMLKRFSTYFLREAKELIEYASKEKIAPPDVMINLQSPQIIDHDKRTDHTVSKFFHDLNSPFDSLSEREWDCFTYYLNGFNHTEIGRLLNLSSRTIDCYFNRIKYKLNCRNKVELIDLALKHGLIEFYI